jgi:hypothetical protein
MRRAALQIVTAVLGAVPVITGVIGLAGINDPLYGPVTTPWAVLLDTNLRFYSGVWLALGLALWWLVPAIERQTTPYRVIWGAVGGIGRLVSIGFADAPPAAASPVVAQKTQPSIGGFLTYRLR